MEVVLPFNVPQETAVRRKQQRNRGEKKIMSGVRSAREKSQGKEGRAGKVQGEPMDLAAFEYVRAAGFWNALSDKSSFVTNARRFPSFPSLTVYGLLAHSRKLFFYWRKTRIRKGHEQGAPVGTGHPEPNLNPRPAGSSAWGRAAKSATWIPDRNRLLRKVFEGAFLRAFQTLYVKKNMISSADGFFQHPACHTSTLRLCCGAATALVSQLERDLHRTQHSVLQENPWKIWVPWLWLDNPSPRLAQAGTQPWTSRPDLHLQPCSFRLIPLLPQPCLTLWKSSNSIHRSHRGLVTLCIGFWKVDQEHHRKSNVSLVSSMYTPLYLSTRGPDKREHELLPKPPWWMRHHSYFHFADEEWGVEEAVLHGREKSATWTCPKFSVLLQPLMWNRNIPKTKPFGPLSTSMLRALLTPTARLPSHPVSLDRKQSSSALPGDLLQSERWLFTVDTALEGSQALPQNNRLLFLTFTLSSCSHKSQISHISRGVLACLSTAAKFKACYHSPACWFRDTWKHKKNKVSK